jgi:hypothetical protein
MINVVPGCEFIFAIINTIWPTNCKFQQSEGADGYIEGIESLSNIQYRVVQICLRGMYLSLLFIYLYYVSIYHIHDILCNIHRYTIYNISLIITMHL